MEMMTRQKAGDVVTLRIRRGDEELELKPKLTKRPVIAATMQNNMGSGCRAGARATDDPAYDAVVSRWTAADQCRSRRRYIGINICRAGRTESWAVPRKSSARCSPS